MLGQGGFGKVYRGWVDVKTLAPSKAGSGMMVAIKRLNSESVQGFAEWRVRSISLFSKLNLQFWFLLWRIKKIAQLLRNFDQDEQGLTIPIKKRLWL